MDEEADRHKVVQVFEQISVQSKWNYLALMVGFAALGAMLVLFVNRIVDDDMRGAVVHGSFTTISALFLVRTLSRRVLLDQAHAACVKVLKCAPPSNAGEVLQRQYAFERAGYMGSLDTIRDQLRLK
jgi:hypothetical protein